MYLLVLFTNNSVANASSNVKPEFDITRISLFKALEIEQSDIRELGIGEQDDKTEDLLLIFSFGDFKNLGFYTGRRRMGYLPAPKTECEREYNLWYSSSVYVEAIKACKDSSACYKFRTLCSLEMKGAGP